MKSRKLILAIFCSVVFISAASIAAYADEVYLDNGDRLTGSITSATKDKLTIHSDAAGDVTLDRKHVQRVEPASRLDELAVKPPKLWSGDAALGYNLAAGNTRTSLADLKISAARKTDQDELDLKTEDSYASSDSKMSSQKYYGLAQYSQKYGARNQWYRYVKQEADHDRFANINYRLIPSAGVGYHFFDEPDWKLQLEAGVGLQYTHFRDDTKDATQLIVDPRLYVERTIHKLKLSEDLTVYPALTGADGVRLHSESAAQYPISTRWSGRLSLIDDYNSKPAASAKTNDVDLVSSLAYSF